MPTVKELYDFIDGLFPREYSCEWDNDGLMVCVDSSKKAGKVLITLDVTEKVADYAQKNGFDVIISHHPLIFRKLSGLSEQCPAAALPIKLISSGISVMSFHTRFDAGKGGMNDTLAEMLGLDTVSGFGPDGDDCGRICDGDIAFDTLLEKLKTVLGAPALTFTKVCEKCRKIALLGGDGKDFVFAALAAGADTFITGDAGYNVMLDAAARGLSVIEAGHYYTEYSPFVEKISALLAEKFPGLETEFYRFGCEISNA